VDSMLLCRLDEPVVQEIVVEGGASTSIVFAEGARDSGCFRRHVTERHDQRRSEPSELSPRVIRCERSCHDVATDTQPDEILKLLKVGSTVKVINQCFPIAQILRRLWLYLRLRTSSAFDRRTRRSIYVTWLSLGHYGTYRAIKSPEVDHNIQDAILTEQRPACDHHVIGLLWRCCKQLYFPEEPCDTCDHRWYGYGMRQTYPHVDYRDCEFLMDMQLGVHEYIQHRDGKKTVGDCGAGSHKGDGPPKPTRKKFKDMPAEEKKAVRAARKVERNRKLVQQANFLKADPIYAAKYPKQRVIQGRGDYTISGEGIGRSVGGWLGGKAEAWIRSLFGGGDYKVVGQRVKHNKLIGAQDPQLSTPRMGGTEERVITMSNTETMVSNFPMSEEFQLSRYPIDASSPLTFPVLSKTARNYTEVVFEGIVFYWCTSTSDTSTSPGMGRIAAGISYDVDSLPPTSMEEIENSLYGDSVKPSLNMATIVECASGMTTLKNYKIGQPGQAREDPSFYQLGWLNIGTDGAPSAYKAGEWRVTYKVKLLKPLSNADQSAQMCELNLVNLSAFGTFSLNEDNPSNINSIGLMTDPAETDKVWLPPTLPINTTLLCVYYAEGTSTASIIAPTFSFGGGLNGLPYFPIYGGTAISFAYPTAATTTTKVISVFVVQYDGSGTEEVPPRIELDNSPAYPSSAEGSFTVTIISALAAPATKVRSRRTVPTKVAPVNRAAVRRRSPGLQKPMRKHECDAEWFDDEEKAWGCSHCGKLKEVELPDDMFDPPMSKEEMLASTAAIKLHLREKTPAAKREDSGDFTKVESPDPPVRKQINGQQGTFAGKCFVQTVQCDYAMQCHIIGHWHRRRFGKRKKPDTPKKGVPKFEICKMMLVNECQIADHYHDISQLLRSRGSMKNYADWAREIFEKGVPSEPQDDLDVEMPALVEPERNEMPVARVQRGWEEMKTPDGRRYYVCHETQTSHWELPPIAEAEEEIPIADEAREEEIPMVEEADDKMVVEAPLIIEGEADDGGFLEEARNHVQAGGRDPKVDAMMRWLFEPEVDESQPCRQVVQGRNDLVLLNQRLDFDEAVKRYDEQVELAHSIDWADPEEALQTWAFREFAGMFEAGRNQAPRVEVPPPYVPPIQQVGGIPLALPVQRPFVQPFVPGIVNFVPAPPPVAPPIAPVLNPPNPQPLFIPNCPAPETEEVNLYMNWGELDGATRFRDQVLRWIWQHVPLFKEQKVPTINLLTEIQEVEEVRNTEGSTWQWRFLKRPARTHRVIRERDNVHRVGMSFSNVRRTRVYTELLRTLWADQTLTVRKVVGCMSQSNTREVVASFRRAVEAKAPEYPDYNRFVLPPGQKEIYYDTISHYVQQRMFRDVATAAATELVIRPAFQESGHHVLSPSGGTLSELGQ